MAAPVKGGDALSSLYERLILSQQKHNDDYGEVSTDHNKHGYYIPALIVHHPKSYTLDL